MILLFQGHSSPPDIRQQAECSLYEYKLDDKNLQKAQLEQHKMFQNCPTIPAPAVPSAPPPPLVMVLKPKVPWIRGQNESDNASSDALFDTKANNTFFADKKPLTHTHIYENRRSTHCSSRRRLSDLLALQSRVYEADDLFAFPG